MNPIIYHMFIDQIIIFLWLSYNFLWLSMVLIWVFPMFWKIPIRNLASPERTPRAWRGALWVPWATKNGGVLDWCFLNNG